MLCYCYVRGRSLPQRRLVLQWGGAFAWYEVDSHFGTVFLPVVRQGNGLVVSFHAVCGHGHPGTRGDRLQDGDVIHSLPITVMYLELPPIRGEARYPSEVVAALWEGFDKDRSVFRLYATPPPHLNKPNENHS